MCSKRFNKRMLSGIVFGVGLGVYLHDRVAEWVALGCRLHGLDVGVALIVAAWVILSLDVIEWFRRYVNT